jgi:hypothetical protein
LLTSSSFVLPISHARILISAWFRNLLSLQAASAILSSFGALWLAVEITAYFSEGTELPDKIRAGWPVFAAVGMLIALGLRYPRLSITCKLDGRDVTLEIAVGDVFAMPGALIVGSNTTFDTRLSSGLISERSVQGAFTKKYYKDETQLDAELAVGLAYEMPEQLQGERIGKTTRYSIGTCVRLNPKERTGYFVAICHVNEHGVASGTFDDLKEALARLWLFIGQRGSRDQLVMPVLGTGFGRLVQPREEIIRETIKSFVAACSEMICADKLTIVITPQDIARHGISLEELGSFLKHECRYTKFSRSTTNAVGRPIN